MDARLPVCGNAANTVYILIYSLTPRYPPHFYFLSSDIITANAIDWKTLATDLSDIVILLIHFYYPEGTGVSIFKSLEEVVIGSQILEKVFPS